MKNSSMRSAMIGSVAASVLVLAACAPDQAPAPTSSSVAASTTASTSSSATSSSATSSGSTSSSGTAGGSSAAATASAEDISAATAALIAPGKLTVCTHLPYAPFQSNDDTGKTVGFDVDIMDLVATDLGVAQTIVDTPFEGIKSGQDLNTGKCDIAAAGMTITDERKQVLLFSDPYFDATQALLVRAGDNFTSLGDLKGKRIGAQTATTGLEYAKKLQAQFGYEIVEFNDLASESQALIIRDVDAAVNDLPVWADYVKKNPAAAKIAVQFDTGEQYGFGMKLGNAALKTVVDAALSTARSDGTYDQIFTKWIGEVPAV